jgi:hypothetical protein
VQESRAQHHAAANDDKHDDDDEDYTVKSEPGNAIHVGSFAHDWDNQGGLKSFWSWLGVTGIVNGSGRCWTGWGERQRGGLSLGSDGNDGGGKKWDGDRGSRCGGMTREIVG